MASLLFVCVENSNRSQMAEAFARIHGGGRVEAASAGSRPLRVRTKTWPILSIPRNRCLWSG